MQVQFNIIDIFKGINPNTSIFSFLYKYIQFRDMCVCTHIHTYMYHIYTQ